MITIRKANSEDTLQLEKLFLKTRQATFTWEPLEKFRIEDYKRSTEGETVFLAEDDVEKAIGFTSVWTHVLIPRNPIGDSTNIRSMIQKNSFSSFFDLS